MNEETRNLQREVQERDIEEKAEVPVFVRFIKGLFKIIFIILISVALFFPFNKIEEDSSPKKNVLCYNPITQIAFMVEMVGVEKENDLNDEIEEYYLIKSITKGFVTVYTSKNTDGENVNEFFISLFYFKQKENENEKGEFTVWEIFEQVFFKGGIGSYIKRKTN